MQVAHGKLYVKDKEGKTFLFIPSTITKNNTESSNNIINIQASDQDSILKLILTYANGNQKSVDLPIFAIETSVITNLS